jgi:hypothetical protein
MGDPHEREILSAEVLAQLFEQVPVMTRALGAAGPTRPIAGIHENVLPVGQID